MSRADDAIKAIAMAAMAGRDLQRKLETEKAEWHRAQEIGAAEWQNFRKSTLPAEWYDILVTRAMCDVADLRVTIWSGQRGSPRRIYANWGRDTRDIAIYHVTASRGHVVGSMEMGFRFTAENKAALIDLCKRTAAMMTTWTGSFLPRRPPSSESQPSSAWDQVLGEDTI